MIQKMIWPLFGLMLMLSSVTPARATVMLSVEPAITDAGLGDPVTVDLTVSGLGDFSAPSLSAFDVDIGFDPAILGFSSAAFGTGLDLFGLGSFQGVIPGAGTVKLFEVSLDLPSDLDSLQPGAFTRASLTFDTLKAGASVLSLTLHDLGDALGDPLEAVLSGAQVSVTTPEPPPAPVPAPATPGLFLLGIFPTPASVWFWARWVMVRVQANVRFKDYRHHPTRR